MPRAAWLGLLALSLFAHAQGLSDVALREMARVVTSRAVVLEFVRPSRGLVGGAYRLYLRTVLPAALAGARVAERKDRENRHEPKHIDTELFEAR